MKNKRNYPCPCCGYLTISETPPGTFEICPICFWEDDEKQFYNPLLKGGANKVSLEEARYNFKKFGAISKNERKYTRKPLLEELPSSNKK